MTSRRRNSNKNLGNSISDVRRRLKYLERKPIRTKLQKRVINAAAIAPSSITADEVDFGTTVITPENPEDVIDNPKDGLLVFDPDTNGAFVYSEDQGDYVEIKDSTAQASADGKNTIYRQDYEPTGGTYVLGDVWFDTDDSNKIYRYSAAATATVTNKALTSNVATLTVSSAHTFVVGETITVSGVDATFNGSYEVTATPTAVTVRYAKIASNVTSTGSSGTITNTAGWKGFALGDGALLNISASKITAGTIDASVITVSNLDAGNITTGTITGRAITGATITGSTFQLAAGAQGGLFTITNTLLYSSPSLTWGPTASPYFEIYQFGGGSATVINADGDANNGFLFINAAARIELQAPEIFSLFTIKMPSASSSASYGTAGLRNIYPTATAGTPSGGSDGDIVVVYT
jgi:hypothetical protein